MTDENLIINLREIATNLQARNCTLEEENEKLKQQTNQLLDEKKTLEDKIREAEEIIGSFRNEYITNGMYIVSLEDENKRMRDFLTERSNSERGIEPKKERMGYVIKKCRECNDTIKVQNGYETVAKEFSCWEYTIETPYKYQTTNERDWIYRHVVNEDLLFDMLELVCIFKHKNVVLNDVFKNADNDFNYAYDFRLELNAHTGYWSITFKTLYQLSVAYSEELFNFKG